ncbi:MAG: transglutaminaseTgpA domain-containing protein [Methylophilaceae bacterium]
MKKPLNILHWFNQNQLFVVLLPLIAFYAFILPSWAIVSYFLCWIITYLNLKNKILLNVIYIALISANLILYRNIFDADFWIILLLLCIPIAHLYDHEKDRSLLLTIISFITAAIFIFKPNFFIAILAFIWINIFLIYFIKYKYHFNFDFQTINFRIIGMMLFFISLLTAIIFLLLPRFQMTMLGEASRGKNQGVQDFIDLYQQDKFYAADPYDVYKIKMDQMASDMPYWKVHVLTDYKDFKWVKSRNVTFFKAPKQSYRSYSIIENNAYQNQYLPVLGNAAITTSKHKYWAGANGELSLQKILNSEYEHIKIKTFNLKPFKRTINLNHDLNSKYTNWAREQYNKFNNDQEFIKFLENYFGQNFSYKIKNLNLDKENPLDSFFFDVRKGSCTHFAVAMVNALRANNIPANIVTGYLGGQWNIYGNYYKIGSDNAHAWVEAKVNDEWIYIDPTLKIENIESDAESIAFRNLSNSKASFINEIAAYLDNINTLISFKILNYGYQNRSINITNKSLIEIILFIATPGVIFLLLIFVFNKSSLLTSSRLQKEENNWRKYLNQKGFSLSNLNSLEIFQDENNNVLHEQAGHIMEINKTFLKLRYGNINIEENKRLLNNLKKKIKIFKKCNPNLK